MLVTAESAKPVERTTSRRRTVLWTLAFSYVGIVLVVARNFVLVPVYLGYLPLAEYGAWLATAGVLAQVLFIDFGLAGPITQRVAAAHGSGDRAELASVVGSSLAIAGVLGVLVSLVTAAMGPLAARAMQLDGETSARFAGCFLVLALGSGPSVAGFVVGCILRSLQRPIFTGGAFVLAEVAAIGATVALLLAGGGLWALAAGLALRGVLNFGLNLVDCRRAAVGLKLRLHCSADTAKSLLRDTSRQFATAVAMKLQGNADPFFIATLISPEVAAVYALTVRAHEAVVMLLALIGGSVSPALAHVAGAGQRELFARVVRSLWIALAIAGAVGFVGVIAFNRDFVALWVGTGLYAGNAVTLLAAGASFALLLGTAPYETLMAKGRFATVARVFVTTSVLHLVLLVSLLQLGPWGAALAALISLGVRATALGVLSTAEAGLALRPLDLVRIVVPVLAVGIVLNQALPSLHSWPELLSAMGAYCAAVTALVWVLNRGSIAALRDQFIGRDRATAGGAS